MPIAGGGAFASIRCTADPSRPRGSVSCSALLGNTGTMGTLRFAHPTVHFVSHFARSIASTTRQRFSLLSGRVSMIRTTSPT
jgi:hypothetical protein